MTTDEIGSDQNRPLRVACLGGGFNSAVGRTHNVALRMDHRFEVVAGCFSTRQDENALSGRRYGLSSDNLYPTLDSLLAVGADKFDAIVILTPTDQHAIQVSNCLAHKVPVICEKALAVSSEEIRAMLSQMEAANGYLAVTFNYLGYPMIRELRAMIAAGELGKIEQIHIEMPQEGFLKRGADDAPMTPQAWRLKDHKVPTLALDLGVHVHSLVHFLTGQRPIEAVAMASTFGNFPQVIDNTICMARYSGEIDCNIWFSKVANQEVYRIRIKQSVGIGKDQDLTSSFSGPPIEGESFPTALLLDEKFDSVRRSVRADDLLGPILAAIGDDQ